MNDTTNLEDIFEAMEEIDLLSKERKNKKKILILNKNHEIVTKQIVSKKVEIPLDTEELIKQAEKQLD